METLEIKIVGAILVLIAAVCFAPKQTAEERAVFCSAGSRVADRLC